MFEKASRLKLRFESGKGLITIEDLWDLPLTTPVRGSSLDTIAKSISKQVKDSAEESFVTKTSSKNQELELKFEIVKHIIKVRLNEQEQKENALILKTKKEKIASLIAKKEDAELENLSIDELKKLI